jgi:hypothetical protein
MLYDDENENEFVTFTEVLEFQNEEKEKSQEFFSNYNQNESQNASYLQKVGE